MLRGTYKLTPKGKEHFEILDIPGVLKGRYSVSTHGRVYNTKLKRFCKLHTSNKGYLKVSIYFDGKQKTVFVHRLVLCVFNPIRDAHLYDANHLDSDRKNNHISNLEWATSSENSKHAFEKGNRHRGTKNSKAKITDEIAIEIWKMYNKGKSKNKIIEVLNLDKYSKAPKDLIDSMLKGVAWNHITGKPIKRWRKKK